MSAGSSLFLLASPQTYNVAYAILIKRVAIVSS
jgi:hypothetical protein